MLKRIALAVCLASVSLALPATAQNPYSVVVFKPAANFTTTSTSTPINLGNPRNSWSVGNITLTGSSLTTVTFSVLGSSDGTDYAALPVSALATPTTTATTITASAAGIYQVNLAGFTFIKFQTSGTFTATSVQLLLSASPNGSLARSGGGGGTPFDPASPGPIGGTTPNAVDATTVNVLPTFPNDAIVTMTPFGAGGAQLIVRRTGGDFLVYEPALAEGAFNVHFVGGSTSFAAQIGSAGVFGVNPNPSADGTSPDVGWTRGGPGSWLAGFGTFGDMTATVQAGVTATDPGCTTTAHLGKLWFDITTTTTVLKACMNIAGTPTWVTK